MISCIVIEDQPPAQRILKKYINDVEILELSGVFASALAALDFLKENPVDLLFLDIHLPKLSGIDFLAILPQKPYVIITTAFSDYAIQGYELDVMDYLLKPFSFERFLKAVLKVQRQLEKSDARLISSKNDPKSILVKVGYDLIKIKINNILYIKSEGDYTWLYCCEDKYLASYPLKHWLEILPAKHFIQIHRSYIVNITHIQKVTASKVFMHNYTIPIGRVYKKDFQDSFLSSQEK